MNKKLFDRCLSDLKRCSDLGNTSDTWIKTSNIIKKGFDFNNLKNLQSNTNFYSIVGIDTHPALTFDNPEEKRIFDSIVKTKESNICQPHKNIKVKNKNFSAYYLGNAKIAAKIINYYKPKKTPITILEIGGGIGLLSSILLSKINCKIILCDLPQTLSIQRFFLTNLFKSRKHNFIANDKDKYKEDFDINYVNCNLLFKQKFNLDLAFNIDSFQEMKLETINNYIKFIELNLKEQGKFIHQNTVGHSTDGSVYPSGYNLPDSLKIENIEYNFPSERGLWHSFLTVCCTKESKKNNKNLLINKRKKILKQFYQVSCTKPHYHENNKIKNSIIASLNSTSKSKYPKASSCVKKNSTDLKINLLFQKLNDSILKDLVNLDSSFSISNLTIKNLFKNSKIFEDSYWGIKISSILYGVEKFDLMNKSLNFITNNSFDVLYRKLVLFYRSKNLEKADEMFNQLTRHPNNDFLSDLKLLNCSTLLNKNLFYKKLLTKLLNSVKNKNQALLLSSIVLNQSFDEYFFLKNRKKYFDVYLSKQDLVELLISFDRDTLINNCDSQLFKNFNISNKNQLSNFILSFKLDKVSEKNFITLLKKKISSDYFSIGKVLLKTFPDISKENILYFSNKSYSLRKNNFMNEEFLGNILLHSGLYREAIKKFKNIKVLDKNIFSPSLKYQLCSSILLDPYFEKYLENMNLPFITFDEQRIFFPNLITENASRIL